MEKLIAKIILKLQNINAGIVTAVVFFIIALLLCIFGFLKTLFIVIFTIGGFIFGAFFFSDSGRLKRFLDRILPPGRVR